VGAKKEGGTEKLSGACTGTKRKTKMSGSWNVRKTKQLLLRRSQNVQGSGN